MQRAHRRSCCRIKGKRTVDSFHRELGQHHVGLLRHGAQRGRACKTALAEDPGAARGVLAATCNVLGDGRGAEPVAGEGGPRGRLPGVRRADVPRRARARASPAAATSARSTRRRTARRCATTSTSPTSRPGSTRARASRPTRHEEPLDVRVRPPDAAELQMMDLTLHVWRQKDARRRGPVRHLRRARTSAPTCRSSRCSTSSTRG